MGKILGAYFFPHPPIIIPEIGQGEEKKVEKTIEGVKALSLDIKKKSPSTILVITPHGPLFSDAISISVEKKLVGDFEKFGESSLKFQYENNLDLTNKIINKSLEKDIVVAEVDKHFATDYNVETKLDHGTLVPLYYVDKEYKDYKLIHITYGILSPSELYRFGRIIQESILESNDNVVIIGSGDLSHKLSDEGPYGYSPKGSIFDEKIIHILQNGDLEDIITFDLELAESAGECGLRTLMIITGILDGYKLDSKVLSYEGTFGVGYTTAKLNIIGDIVVNQLCRKSLLDRIEESKKFRIEKIRNQESIYVKLARRSLEHYVKFGEKMKLPKGLPEKFYDDRRGSFVTLKKDGILRGCIGTIEPTEENLGLEIIKNAVLAGMEDPRFDRVTEYELKDIIYSVDILYKPEKINSKEELDTQQYGIIVSNKYKKGLLLPNIEGINTVEEQIDIALKKANIKEGEEYIIERFKVERYY